MVVSEATTIQDIAFVGGRLCLDFVNTANWQDDTVFDERLRRSADVHVWAVRQGLVAPDETVEVEADLDEVLELRDVVRTLLLSHIDRAPDPDRLRVEVLRRCRAYPPGELHVDPEGHRLTGSDLARSLLRVVADSVTEVLLTVPSTRVKRCPGQRCGWLFLDASPNLRRRWCSMATCGNRAKSRRHHARHRRP